jgi:transposase-like protein
MTPKTKNNQVTPLSQAEFQEIVREKMRQAVRFTLITVLEAELEAFIGAAPYQRTAQRRAYRNGTYQRSLTTSVGQIDDLEVPRTRQGFQTQLFERYQRRQAELDASICQMFVGGVAVYRKLCKLLIPSRELGFYTKFVIPPRQKTPFP